MSRLRDSRLSNLYPPEAGVDRSPKSRLQSAGLRGTLRHALDSVFCRKFDDKITLGDGEGAQWTLRVGSLNHSSIVYSGGVGGDISFEIELVRRFGVSVVIFDPSPIALETIKKHSRDPEMQRMEFVPVGLAAENKDLLFAPSNVPGEWRLAANDSHGSRAISCTTITGEMAKRGHKRIDLLKLDIEGFEYQTLNHCLKNYLDIGQICVEFHDFLPDIGRKETLEAILALRRHNFSLIHKHRHDFTFLKS